MPQHRRHRLLGHLRVRRCYRVERTPLQLRLSASLPPRRRQGAVGPRVRAVTGHELHRADGPLLGRRSGAEAMVEGVGRRGGKAACWVDGGGVEGGVVGAGGAEAEAEEEDVD